MQLFLRRRLRNRNTDEDSTGAILPGDAPIEAAVALDEGEDLKIEHAEDEAAPDLADDAADNQPDVPSGPPEVGALREDSVPIHPPQTRRGTVDEDGRFVLGDPCKVDYYNIC